MSYVFAFPTLVPVVLSKFMVEHVTGQLRLLILVAPCWMETPWLPQFTICWQAFLVGVPWERMVMDVLVGWVLRGSLPQSLRQWWGQLKHLQQSVPAMLQKWHRLCASEDVPNNTKSVTYLGLDWLGTPLVFIIQLFQLFRTLLSSKGFK